MKVKRPGSSLGPASFVAALGAALLAALGYRVWGLAQARLANLRATEDAFAGAEELWAQVISYFLVFVPTIREIRDFYREM